VSAPEVPTVPADVVTVLDPDEPFQIGPNEWITRRSVIDLLAVLERRADVPTGWVDITHPETGGTARVPARALKHKRARGWVPLDELPPPPADTDTDDDHPTTTEPEASASSDQEPMP
jgi:hypothetical protein